MRLSGLRYVAGGLAAAVAVVGGVVGVGVLRDDDQSRGDDRVTAGRASTASGDIAAIVDGKVVVLSSLDGMLVRTLAEGAESAKGLSVSPDGTTAYFTRADPDTRCGDRPTDDIARYADSGRAFQIVSVPIEGGPITVVASGASPELSPDGRLLAYADGRSTWR